MSGAYLNASDARAKEMAVEHMNLTGNKGTERASAAFHTVQ